MCIDGALRFRPAPGPRQEGDQEKPESAPRPPEAEGVPDNSRETGLVGGRWSTAPYRRIATEQAPTSVGALDPDEWPLHGEPGVRSQRSRSHIISTIGKARKPTKNMDVGSGVSSTSDGKTAMSVK